MFPTALRFLYSSVGPEFKRTQALTGCLADDALAWEKPKEAINMLDDSVLDRFIPQFWDSFSPVQTGRSRVP
jgi:hypothetical protein